MWATRDRSSPECMFLKERSKMQVNVWSLGGWYKSLKPDCTTYCRHIFWAFLQLLPLCWLENTKIVHTFCCVFWYLILSTFYFSLFFYHFFQPCVCMCVCAHLLSTGRFIRRIQGTAAPSAWSWCQEMLWNRQSWMRSHGICRTIQGSGPVSMGSWKVGRGWLPLAPPMIEWLMWWVRERLLT